MKMLQFTLYGKTFRARLLEQDVPKTVAALEAACPFESVVIHAKLNDEEIYLQTPLALDVPENLDYPRKGYVLYERSKQVICMWYGTGYPIGFLSHIAVVEDAEDLKTFAEVGAKVWEKQGERIKVELVDA